MSSTESPISITVKTPAGSLVTVRADNGDQLDALVSSALAALDSAVKELETTLRVSAPQSAPVSPAVGYLAQSMGATVVSQQDTPPFSGTPSLDGGRSCKHGKMTALQGPAKNGGVYKGYFCPTPQGSPDKCRTEYVQKFEPEWNTFVPDRIK
jgi:hypothetical protein